MDFALAMKIQSAVQNTEDESLSRQFMGIPVLYSCNPASRSCCALPSKWQVLLSHRKLNLKIVSLAFWTEKDLGDLPPTLSSC